MGSPAHWTHVGTSTANKSEPFPDISSTRAPITELYKCYVTTCSQHDVGSPEHWTCIRTSTANKSEEFPGISSTCAPITELYKWMSPPVVSSIPLQPCSGCLVFAYLHQPATLQPTQVRWYTELHQTFNYPETVVSSSVQKSGLFCNTFLCLYVCFQRWHNAQTGQLTFIHSIDMCRMRRFLAVLKSFFHPSLLCTFSCHTSPLTILHPLSPHLAIYSLVYLSILLFPNSYIIPFWEFYFPPFSFCSTLNFLFFPFKFGETVNIYKLSANQLPTSNMKWLQQSPDFISAALTCLNNWNKWTTFLP